MRVTECSTWASRMTSWPSKTAAQMRNWDPWSSRRQSLHLSRILRKRAWKIQSWLIWLEMARISCLTHSGQRLLLLVTLIIKWRMCRGSCKKIDTRRLLCSVRPRIKRESLKSWSLLTFCLFMEIWNKGLERMLYRSLDNQVQTLSLWVLT